MKGLIMAKLYNREDILLECWELSDRVKELEIENKKIKEENTRLKNKQTEGNF